MSTAFASPKNSSRLTAERLDGWGIGNVLWGWVTVEKFSQDSGYTPKAVYEKTRKRVWIEGTHWKKAPDGRVLLNLPALDSWVKGQSEIEP